MFAVWVCVLLVCSVVCKIGIVMYVGVVCVCIMESDDIVLITVSGPPASGTSTLSERLADVFDVPYIDGGMMFREMAAERGVSLAELTRQSESDESIDRGVDNRLESIVLEASVGYRTGKPVYVVESRLAGWHASKLSACTFSVYLDADEMVRFERSSGRSESLDEMKHRELSEWTRFKRMYGVDITDSSLYDVCIDTTEKTPYQVLECVLRSLPYSEDQLSVV